MKTLGLALSGGGARGFAHIGVLSVLVKAGISIDYICGTSFGGIIAAAYAIGISPEEMEQKSLEFASMRQLIKLMDPSPLRKGFLEGNKVRAYLEKWLGTEINFANTRIPLGVNAVDLVTGKEIFINSGNVLDAVFATIAFPGLFSPVKRGEAQLVDGGVLNNLPIKHVRNMGAEVVLGVEVQIDPSKQLPWTDLPQRPHFALPLPDFFLEFYRAELIMVAELTRHQIIASPPDLLISPEIPSDITMFLSFPRAMEIIQMGKKATEASLPQIEALIR